MVFSHEDGRFFAPPFSRFLPEGNEKTGRARSKRKTEGSPLRGDEGRGTRKAYLRFLRMPSARGVALAGVWRSPNGPAPLSAAATLAVRGRCPPFLIEHPVGPDPQVRPFPQRLPFSRQAIPPGPPFLAAEYPVRADLCAALGGLPLRAAASPLAGMFPPSSRPLPSSRRWN